MLIYRMVTTINKKSKKKHSNIKQSLKASKLKASKSKVPKSKAPKSTANQSPYLIALHETIKNINKNTVVNKPGFSPMSGTEPKWEPGKWNDRHKIKYTHNCYAYVLNKILPQRMGKPQPGYFSNFPPLTFQDYQCLTFYKRLKKDMPSMYITTFEQRCKNGFFKGYIALDDKEADPDYHFYRQDSTGFFSHKPGRTDAVDFDASGHKIINPETANRNYQSFNYRKGCFFFCLNPELSKAHAQSNFT